MKQNAAIRDDPARARSTASRRAATSPRRSCSRAGRQDESKSGGIQVDGASGSENRFIIDGMDTTNLQNGTSGKTMLLDFVQEVQVKSSGYNAEFGGATGGVVNVITKSGSNTFRGQLGTYLHVGRALRQPAPVRPLQPVEHVRHRKARECSGTGATATTETTTPTGTRSATSAARSSRTGSGSTAGSLHKTDYSRDATFYTDPTKTNRHFDWWSDAKYVQLQPHHAGVEQPAREVQRVEPAQRKPRDAPAFQPANSAHSDSRAIPHGVPAKQRFSTFDRNADGRINQTAYDTRWVKQGGNCTNDTYSGNLDWVITPTFFVNAAAAVRTATTTRRRRSSAATPFATPSAERTPTLP